MLILKVVIKNLFKLWPTFVLKVFEFNFVLNAAVAFLAYIVKNLKPSLRSGRPIGYADLRPDAFDLLLFSC